MATIELQPTSADFEVDRSSVKAFKRLSYTMWHALAEFVDNSTQSRINYGNLIDEVLKNEGTTLKVEINYDKVNRVITIDDNSIGMTLDDLVNALKVARPTPDSKGRSKYGMGMKTAACWIGEHWSITTCEWGSGLEWTAVVDVDGVCTGTGKIPLSVRQASKDSHYTKVKIWGLYRNIQKRTEETISKYLGSMYRFDIRDKKLILLFNGNPVVLPEEMEMAKFENGQEARETIDTEINGKKVIGWFGALMSGGRKYGGFSIFQNGRQIRGYPDGWKPKSVFGGEDDEGGNSLVSQRLIGEITLDGFEVSHTKDSILFSGTEEEDLELFLAEATRNIKTFASTMRKGSAKGTPWAKQKVQDLVNRGRKDHLRPPLSEGVSFKHSGGYRSHSGSNRGSFGSMGRGNHSLF